MIDIIEYGKFKPTGINKEKRQIILCHTSREAGEYLASLKFRYNSNYDKIPNYLVNREGRVVKLLPDEGYSKFFAKEKINVDSIIITLENLGWLEKKQLSNHYINWKGSIYNKEVFERKWRDYFYWQPYTDKQIDSVTKLCLSLIDDFKISRKFIGHNVMVDDVDAFDGIVTRSNYDRMYTDLNPSFDFIKFLENIEDEQYSRN